MSKFFKRKFVDLSNLQRQIALSASFDNWLSYCLLSVVRLYFDFFQGTKTVQLNQKWTVQLKLMGNATNSFSQEL